MSPLSPDRDLRGADLAAWRDMVRDLRVQQVSPRTIETYGEGLAQFARSGVASVTDATRDEISAYLIGLAEAGRSKGTILNRFRALRRFYNWAEAEAIIERSPMAKMPVPQQHHKAPNVLDAGELGRLLGACAGRSYDDLRDTAMIMLWSEPGSPRVTEMISIELADVDLEHDVVLLRGKGSKDRLVKMGPETARAWSRLLRARARRADAGESTAALLGLKGALTRSGAQQMLARRSRQAGLGRVHPHQLRHTSTHRALRAGMSDRDVSRLMGHSTTRMVSEVYGRQAAALAALEASAEVNLTAGLAPRSPKLRRIA